MKAVISVIGFLCFCVLAVSTLTSCDGNAIGADDSRIIEPSREIEYRKPAVPERISKPEVPIVSTEKQDSGSKRFPGVGSHQYPGAEPFEGAMDDPVKAVPHVRREEQAKDEKKTARIEEPVAGSGGRKEGGSDHWNHNDAGAILESILGDQETMAIVIEILESAPEIMGELGGVFGGPDNGGISSCAPHVIDAIRSCGVGDVEISPEMEEALITLANELPKMVASMEQKKANRQAGRKKEKKNNSVTNAITGMVLRKIFESSND